MSNNFTPGPWKVAPLLVGYDPKYPIQAGTEILAASFHLGKDREKEWKANADLMAAAPDLLEALRGLLVTNPGGRAFTEAHTAIAKAEGRTHA